MKRIYVLMLLFVFCTFTAKGQSNLPPIPVFSHEAGFYNEPFQLEISFHDPSVGIYYTTDGSLPNANSSRISGSLLITDRTPEPNILSAIPTNQITGSYDQFRPPQILVPKATVIRAALRYPDGSFGEPITRTFFVFDEETPIYTLPVISIMVEKEDFFGDEAGIYVPGENAIPQNSRSGNFQNRGEDWERPGSIEFFNLNSHTYKQQDVGYRIHGGWTRAFPQKTLRVYARNQYDNRVLPIELFEGEGVQPYRRFMLRNGGNDWGLSLIRDAVSQSLVSHLPLDTQLYQPTVVFLNGEYWGIHNIRERYDRHYLQRVYGVDPDRVDILEKNAEVKEGTNQHYTEMLDFARFEDISSDSLFRWMETRMDMDNYIAYYAAQVFLGNNDWPHNNIDFWRLNTAFDSTAFYGHDGRWRWLLFDVDRSFGLGTTSSFDMIGWIKAEAITPDNLSWPNILFRNLLENEGFKHRFINQLADLMNTTFRPEHAIAAIDSFAYRIEPEMPRHIQRWQVPSSVVNWHNQLFVMRSFAEARPNLVRGHMRTHFNIGENVDIQIQDAYTEKGYIRVNTVDITPQFPGIKLAEGDWQGTYFENIPIALEAVPQIGYRFSHWVVGDQVSYDRKLRWYPDAEVAIRAVFESTDISGIVPQPWVLADEAYKFESWEADNPPGSYPEAMAFVYMTQSDPTISAQIAGFTSGAYNLNSRSRVNGRDENGFSFINTGNEEGNPGYPGGQIGGVVLALDTRGQSDLAVSWEGIVFQKNSRIYNLRLQYRIGNTGPFVDLTDADGNIVELGGQAVDGQRVFFDRIKLPPALENRSYVQLFWRYYFTGEQVDPQSGQRSELGISEITVSKANTSSVERDEQSPSSFVVMQAYPNPFNSSTNIEIDVKQTSDIRITIFDAMGRRMTTLHDGPMNAGSHFFTWIADNAASGIYLVTAESTLGLEILKITLLR